MKALNKETEERSRVKKRISELDKLTKKTAEDASGNQKSLTQPSIVGLFSAASKASADAAIARCFYVFF